MATALGALVLVLIVGHQLRLVGDFRVDDAYITFSFSKNLAAGQGATYAFGQRVEGYSNFLWMLLSSVPYLIKPEHDPYAPARLLALGFLGVSLWATYRLARPAGLLSAWLAVLVIVANTDLIRALQSGLETVPFTACLTLGWLAYVSESPERRRWSLLAFLPAALMRIDGFVPVTAVVLTEVARRVTARRVNSASFLELLRWGAPFAVPWGAYFGWRWAYYGLPLPTTYYAKTLVAAQQPERGLLQAEAVFRDWGLLALAPFVLLALVPLGTRRARADVGSTEPALTATAEPSGDQPLRLLARYPEWQPRAFGFALLLQVVYVTRVGGDWMPFHRFFLPVLPLLVVLVGFGATRLGLLLGAERRKSGVLALVGSFALLGYSALHMYGRWAETHQEEAKLAEVKHVENHTRQNLIAAVDLLRLVVRVPGERLVTDYAGVFAVETDAHIIDMWGLCNVEIALKGGMEGINPIYGKECAACYADLAPDYFHTFVPLVRDRAAFGNPRQVLAQVFQGFAIDRVIGILRNFVVGRVVEESTGRTLWFFERRRPERPVETRSPAPGYVVEYPFERSRRHR